ncbi:hypothetical protein SDRG_11925 [Saprolegnia diclina VS20]|uniref:EF-hand domain-containing protein n=1 Tax=Saprolegnia diclina (strain VS20) TaxID=1156394 RepID=T0RDL0_SAPDV|nr:hypothetical protein SDRG_11925 [Saprolegnia diclina VS20]EQC30348.1 hypothetical protein SDRG_11925 [Saprolegnia diclina VS20]|eukprot:XP_008616201.1 hypothetical protein SDRG_11925 [Saprolegnia diclina VS20]
MMALSTEDVKRLKSRFVRPLTIDEFVYTMTKSLHEHIQDELEFAMAVIELFETIDVNGDGSLEWDEFAGYIMDAGIAKAEEAISAQSATKLYTKLSFKGELANSTQPITAERTYIAQLLYLAAKSAVAYFEVHADVVHLYVVAHERDAEPRFASTIRLHTAYQAHKVLAIEEVPTRSMLVVSSVLQQHGTITLWDIGRIYGPVPLQRVETPAPHELLLWVPSAQLLLTATGHMSKHQHRKPPSPLIAAYDIAALASVDMEVDVKGVSALCVVKRSTRTAVAFGSFSGLITLHDLSREHADVVLEAHEKGVKAVVHSSKFAYLASIGFYSFAEESTMEILIWNVDNGVLGTALRGHHAALCAITAVDSESHLLSSDELGTCRVWSATSWDCLQVVRHIVHSFGMYKHLHSQLVMPATAHADAVLLCGGKCVEYFDCSITRDREEFIFMAFNATLNLITAATYHRLILWDVGTGKATKVYNLQVIYNERPVRGITAVCMDDRERKLIVGDDAGQILVVNMVNGNLMKELDPHALAITSISYAAKAKCVVSTAMDSSIHICDENNAHGYYVPYAGAPLSVLLRSIHLEAPPPACTVLLSQRSRPSSATDLRPRSNSGLPSSNLHGAQLSIDIVTSQVSEAWDLIATMAHVSGALGECYLQLWDFYSPQLVGSCVPPRVHCGEIMCIAFLGAHPGLLAGFSNGDVFLWGVRRSAAPSQCLFEFKHTAKGSPITCLHVVVTPGAKPDYWVIGGDEAGRVTRWTLTHDMCARALLPKDALPPETNDEPNGAGGRSAEATVGRHTHSEVVWDAIHKSVKAAKSIQQNSPPPTCVYHDVQWSTGPSAVAKLSSVPCVKGGTSLLSCSVAGQVKAWTSDGDPEGTLDYFATRREPVVEPWTVPVDTSCRRRVKEAQARELCSKVHQLSLAMRDPRREVTPLPTPQMSLSTKSPLGSPSFKLTPRTCARFKSLSQLVTRKGQAKDDDTAASAPLDVVLHELGHLDDVNRRATVRKKREIKTVEGILELQRAASLTQLPSQTTRLPQHRAQRGLLKRTLPKLNTSAVSTTATSPPLETVLSYHMKLAHSWQQ